MIKKEITPFSSKLVFAGTIYYQLNIFIITTGGISAYVIGSIAGAVGVSLVIGILIGLIPHALSKSTPKQTLLSYGFKASAWVSVLFALGRISTFSEDFSPSLFAITLLVSVVYYLVIYGFGLYIDSKSKPKKQLADLGAVSKESLVAEVEFGQSSFRIKNVTDKTWGDVRLRLNSRFYMIYPHEIAPGKSILAPYHEFILEDGSRFNIRISVVKQLDIDASIENVTTTASFANKKYVQ